MWAVPPAGSLGRRRDAPAMSGGRPLDSQFTAAGIRQRLDLLDEEDRGTAVNHFVNIVVGVLGVLAVSFVPMFADKPMVKVVAYTLVVFHVFSLYKLFFSALGPKEEEGKKEGEAAGSDDAKKSD